MKIILIIMPASGKTATDEILAKNLYDKRINIYKNADIIINTEVLGK